MPMLPVHTCLINNTTAAYAATWLYDQCHEQSLRDGDTAFPFLRGAYPAREAHTRIEFEDHTLDWDPQYGRFVVFIEFVTLGNGCTEVAIYSLRGADASAQRIIDRLRSLIALRFQRVDDGAALAGQPSGPDLPDTLTGDNRKMVELLRAGRTDTEIGDELYLSRQRVANRLSDLRGTYGSLVVPYRRRSHPENRE